MGKFVRIGLGVVGVGLLASMAINEIRMRRELSALKATVGDGASRLAGPNLDPASAAAASTAAEQIRAYTMRAMAAAQAGSQTNGDPGGPAKKDDQRLTQEQVQENVLNAYGKEARDPAWSPEAARKLNEIVRQTLPDSSRLVSLECRTTMCLVEVRHKDEETSQSWLRTSFHDWPGAIFVARGDEEDGAFLQTLIPIKPDTVPPYAGM
jgi:hypothetical protein